MRPGWMGLAVAAAVLVAPAAQAADFLRFIASSTASWRNPVLAAPGTPAVDITGNGTTDARASWGVDTGHGRSGYRMTGGGNVYIDVYDGGESDIYALGGFTHINAPIGPAAITAIDLDFVVTVAAPNGEVAVVLMPFHFTHDETVNTLDPCPYGGANGQGVNRNGCADLARTDSSLISHSEDFNIDGRTYRVTLGGFLRGREVVSQFLTAEQTSNTGAFIWLQISDATRPGAAVPEPAVWAMMIAGFGMTGAALRQRRRAFAAGRTAAAVSISIHRFDMHRAQFVAIFIHNYCFGSPPPL